MAVRKINESTLTAIGNAIRAKTGGSALINPENMATEIGSIQTGGGDYTIDDIFTANYPYGNVTVNVDFSSLAYCFYGRTGITGLIAPNTTRLHDYALQSCSNLEYLWIPNVYQFSAGAVTGCTKLKYIVAPELVVLYTYSMQNCSSLEAVDIGGTPTAAQGFIRNTVFSGDSKFKTLILRTTERVFPLSNIATFNSCPFASNGTGGTLYVPQALISSYQSDPNWSTILGYANNQILAIEKSYYETHYADGTEIST